MSDPSRSADVQTGVPDGATAGVPETAVEAVARGLFGTLPVGADLGYGYVLKDITAAAVIRLTAEKGATPLRMWVCPAKHDVPSYRASKRFRIGYEGDAPEPDALRVVDRVVAEIARNEAKIPDATYRNYDAGIGLPLGLAGDFGGLGDLQWLGVRAGLKPACRQMFGGAMLQRVIARAQAAGLHIECLPAAEYLAAWTERDVDSGDTLTFIGATAEAAKAALEAERSLARTTLEVRHCEGRRPLRRFILDRRSRRCDRALGRALGYPSCCVKFFVPRVEYTAADLVFAALERTDGPASSLLNNIDLSRALIPHYVCRYTCAASMKYAQALLHELERVDAPGAQALANSLRGLLIFFRGGGYVWLRGTTGNDHRTVAVSGVSWAGEWPDRAMWVQAAAPSNQVVIEGTRATFLVDGGRSETLTLPPIGIARVFA
jgi:hypothetical protein